MSKVNRIKAALAKLLVEASSIDTDKAVLVYDEDALEVGIQVFVENEDGERTPAEDGEYTSEDKVITVADGRISDIKEKEDEQPVEEEPKEEENLAKTEFEAKKLQFEESYGEKEHKIADAVHAIGFDGYLVEAGDDFAVFEVWQDDYMTYKYIRFAISWDEEGNAIAGDYVEVKSAFVPVEDVPVEVPVEENPAEEPKEENFEEEVPSPDGGEETETDSIEKLREEMNELYSKYDDLVKRVEELEGKPAAKPAQEEFKAITRVNSETKETEAIGRLFK